MCILFLAIRQHPRYPLIVLANRDEYFDRPSTSMDWWQDHKDILAGRDQQSGGTWLGVNRAGRFCAVTNLRTVPVSKARTSRGELVSRFLRGDDPTTSSYSSALSRYRDTYNPFNLVFGDASSIHLHSTLFSESRRLEDGFHSVSNGSPDEPWPKMSRGLSELESAIKTSDVLDPSMFIEIMRDTRKPPEKLLPDTGIGDERERQLSSIFVAGEHYGTRSTSLLKFSDQRIDALELTYTPGQRTTECREFQINLLTGMQQTG
ncbi:MAG: NRDE family protein [Pseudomonadota bacterium]